MPVAAKPKPITYAAPSRTTYLKFADETETMLRRDVLNVWFPRTVDHQHGDSIPTFRATGSPQKVQESFLSSRGA